MQFVDIAVVKSAQAVLAPADDVGAIRRTNCGGASDAPVIAGRINDLGSTSGSR